MSSGSIDRVQSDLNAMREALGLGSTWSMVDVRFGYTLAGSCALFALFRWPGSPLPVPMPWAAAGILATIPVWVVYMAFKARTLPPREASRRRDYRFLVKAMLCVFAAAVGYQYWARHIGLSVAQQGGVLLAILGIGTIIGAMRYPRGYAFACGCGLPMALTGLAMPLIPHEYWHSLTGLMGFTVIGPGSLVMRHFVRPATTEENARVLD